MGALFWCARLPAVATHRRVSWLPLPTGVLATSIDASAFRSLANNTHNNMNLKSVLMMVSPIGGFYCCFYCLCSSPSLAAVGVAAVSCSGDLKPRVRGAYPPWHAFADQTLGKSTPHQPHVPFISALSPGACCLAH